MNCQNTLHNIIRQKQTQQAMQGRVLDMREVRCNFCFNWVTGNTLVKKGFNSCTECLNKHLNKKIIVHNTGYSLYHLTLSKDISLFDNEECVQTKSVHQDDRLQNNDSSRKKQKVRLQTQQDTQKSSSGGLFDIKLSAIPQALNERAQHVMDFVRAFNIATSKSLLIDRDNLQKSKPHQSLILQTPDKDKGKNEFLSLNKITPLEDYGRSLDRTRFLERYQYYYDNHTIQEFIEEHPKIEERSQRSKQFGRQILGNDIEKSMSRRSRAPKSHRSKISTQSQILTEQYSEEEVKSRISGFLESKYHSESLNRIMAAYLKQAHQKTTLQNKTLELTNYKISSLDLHGYLGMFNFQNIFIVKLVNVGLTDEQLPVITNFIWNRPVESLVLTGNKLTENCLGVFLNKSLPFLKELYLGNNRINKAKLKENIAELHSKFILYL